MYTQFPDVIDLTTEAQKVMQGIESMFDAFQTPSLPEVHSQQSISATV